MSEKDKHANRFDQLMQQRWTQIERAREMASMTIPTLLPEAGFNNTTDVPTRMLI